MNRLQHVEVLLRLQADTQEGRAGSARRLHRALPAVNDGHVSQRIDQMGGQPVEYQHVVWNGRL